MPSRLNLYSRVAGRAALLNRFGFQAPLKTSLVLARGTGDPTFTRATTATVWGYAADANSGADQVLLTCASGEARFTGARRISEGVWSAFYADGTPIADSTLKGYLAEGARTNLCLQSNELDATWAASHCSVDDQNATAPDGTATADKIIPNTSSNYHYIKQISIATGGSGSFVVSFYAKAAGYTYLLSNTPEGSASGNAGPIWNLSDGTKAGDYSATHTSGIEDAGGGWYRCWFTYTATANLQLDFNVFPTSSVATYEGDGTSGVLVWGVQVEAGTFPSSLIPTTTAAVTRNADLDSWPTTGNFSDTAGTIYFEAEATSWANATGRIVGDAAEGILASSANSGVQGYDGTNTVNGSAGSPSGQIKCAVAWSGTTMNICVNGGTVATGTYDGAWNLSAIFAGNGFFGNIRNVRIAQTALPDAAFQLLTA